MMQHEDQLHRYRVKKVEKDCHKLGKVMWKYGTLTLERMSAVCNVRLLNVTVRRRCFRDMFASQCVAP